MFLALLNGVPNVGMLGRLVRILFVVQLSCCPVSVRIDKINVLPWNIAIYHWVTHHSDVPPIYHRGIIMGITLRTAAEAAAALRAVAPVVKAAAMIIFIILVNLCCTFDLQKYLFVAVFFVNVAEGGALDVERL